MAELLEGIKVIECGIWQQAPAAGSILGDLGADVVKIENPDGGDPSRGLAIHSMGRTAETVASGRSYLTEATNRNKRSVALDLTQKEGREILYKLVRDTDVFIENFRAGVAEKLKIDYETLSQYNPRLIYAKGTAWGLQGPEVHNPAYDFCVLEKSGWGYFAGERGDPPALYVVALGDQISAWVIVISILAALLCRERLNISQSVEVSLLGSLIATGCSVFTHKLIFDIEFPRMSRTNARNPLWNIYRCADDKWIVLAMSQSSRHWPDLCQALGHPELVDHPRFGSINGRTEHCQELISLLESIFTTKTYKEWVPLFEGKDLIYSVAQTVSEVVNSQQAWDNNYITEFDDPRFGRVKLVGFPYSFSKTPPQIKSYTPELGQHTEEVLLEHSYSWEDIAELKEKKIIL